MSKSADGAAVAPASKSGEVPWILASQGSLESPSDSQNKSRHETQDAQAREDWEGASRERARQEEQDVKRRMAGAAYSLSSLRAGRGKGTHTKAAESLTEASSQGHRKGKT